MTLDSLRLLHDRLHREYLKWWPEHAVIGRMHGVMYYLTQALDCPAPVKRALKKSVGATAYTDAARRVFTESIITRDIHFMPPGA